MVEGKKEVIMDDRLIETLKMRGFDEDEIQRAMDDLHAGTD